MEIGGAQMSSVAIIGAGCSGLAAAHELRDAGYSVTLFEKSRNVGGRAATRKQQGFVYDHGAQYIKGGSQVSDSLVTARFRAADLVNITKPVWIFDRYGHIQEGDPIQNAEPKWNYRSGLNTLAEHMAQGLDVRHQVRIGHLQQNVTGWSLFDSSGQRVSEVDRVLITILSGEAVELIATSQVPGAWVEDSYARPRNPTYNRSFQVILGYA